MIKLKYLLNILLQVNWSNVEYTFEDIRKSVYTFPVQIRVLLIMTLIFIIVILVLLGIIMSSRIYKTLRHNKRVEIRKKYQNIFHQLIFEEAQSEERIRNKFTNTDLTIALNRETILEELIHLHENFKGETAERLEEIYLALHFDEDSLNKLKSKRWYLIAKGMKELAIMNVKSAHPEISKFINSKNDILRMETRIALMKLSDYEPMAFLNKETELLSDWDSANIYNMLTKMPEKMIPDFSHWLNSSNKDVIVFCIQMIGRFRQRESVKTLLILLNNQDERIKLTVIRALRELGSDEGEESLLVLYPLSNNIVKNEILKTLEFIGSEKSIIFLEKIIRQPVEDYPISIQAIRSMIAINNVGNKLIDSIFSQAGPQLQLIIQHARDKRL